MGGQDDVCRQAGCSDSGVVKFEVILAGGDQLAVDCEGGKILQTYRAEKPAGHILLGDAGRQTVRRTGPRGRLGGGDSGYSGLRVVVVGGEVWFRVGLFGVVSEGAASLF